MSRRYIWGEERRRSSRIGAYETVHLRLGGTYCIGRVVNLSVEGALVEVDTLLNTLGAELSVGFPSNRGDEAFWLEATACRSAARMIGMHWRGQPPVDVMLRIQAMIGRELDPLQPAEARLAALRARALTHDD